ncbi:hypothetical protein C0Q70_16047 [Pomacea canaliculata]|uniref:Uncharacterized protein n=1 Tax=Pomacea canaliculata TaxID=400727 RepID=A0A2T7NNN9_POMCA|nr:hypothetical protein C0Q70_16047 [Pomacea canaliculata]
MGSRDARGLGTVASCAHSSIVSPPVGGEGALTPCQPGHHRARSEATFVSHLCSLSFTGTRSRKGQETNRHYLICPGGLNTCFSTRDELTWLRASMDDLPPTGLHHRRLQIRREICLASLPVCRPGSRERKKKKKISVHPVRSTLSIHQGQCSEEKIGDLGFEAHLASLPAAAGTLQSADPRQPTNGDLLLAPLITNRP